MAQDSQGMPKLAVRCITDWVEQQQSNMNEPYSEPFTQRYLLSR